jgi:3-hydroxybutyryl-CoA dehydrogenase
VTKVSSELEFGVTRVIKNIGVVGEGKMGSSIFFYLNGFDFKLTWLCSSEEESVKAGKTVQKKLRFQFQNGIIPEKEFISKSENTKVTFLADELLDCDLIIEAVNEDIDTKRMLFESLQKVVSAECIFTTNSSSYLPSQLITQGAGSARFAGMHFFFPVNMKKTVELIYGPQTSEETLDWLNRFLLGINKTPFHQEESNAFVLNRLLLDFQAEAFNILSEGKLPVRDIDEIVKTRFFPIGVFEFFDHVGIDVMLSSIRSYTRNSANREFYRPLFQKLEEMAKLNHLGIKTKHGFYDYTPLQDGSSSASAKTSEQSEYKQAVANRLWDCYMRGVNSVLESGICSRQELGFYVKDYLGMDTDPFNHGS